MEPSPPTELVPDPTPRAGRLRRRRRVRRPHPFPRLGWAGGRRPGAGVLRDPRPLADRLDLGPDRAPSRGSGGLATVRLDGPARPRALGRADRRWRLRPGRPRLGRRGGRRGLGLLGADARPAWASCSPAMGSGPSSPPTAAASWATRCAGLVLVDGGWESLEASTGVDVDEFLRGLDEPPEVMRSLTGVPAPTARGSIPASWDADQDRAARATVVETHAGRVVPATRPHALEACVRAMFTYDPVGDAGRRRRPDHRLDRRRRRGRIAAAALGAVSAARRGRPRADRPRSSFGARRPQPDALPSRARSTAAIAASVGRWRRTDHLDDEDAMQVVYSPNHLAHDIDTETYMGVGVPANEVAERAEKIRSALEADGGFTLTGPTEHGEDPITAVHDEGLLRFLETAWSEVRSQNIPRAFLSADTYPNRAMFEGMSPEAIARLVREPRHVGGRAGFWGLDSAAPLVAGTYAAARSAVDVALTTADLVLDGETAAYGLVPPTRPPRGAGDVRRLLLLQQRGDRRARDHRGPRGAGRDLRRRLPPRQRDAADLLAPRRRPVRLDPRRSGPPVPVFPGPRRRDRGGRGRRREPEHPAPGRRDERRLPRGHGPGHRGDRGRARVDRRRLARLRHLRPRPDRRLRADDGRLPRGRAAGSRRWVGAS